MSNLVAICREKTPIFEEIGVRNVSYKKALRHGLFLVADGPDSAVNRVKDCINQAAGAGLVAAIASAYIGAGAGAIEAAKATFIASATACLGDLAKEVSITLDDRSHWTDWGKI